MNEMYCTIVAGVGALIAYLVGALHGAHIVRRRYRGMLERSGSRFAREL